MRLSVFSRTPADTLTAGSLLVWLDAVVRAYGDDLPLVLCAKDGTELPCLDAHVQTRCDDACRVVFDAQRRARCSA